jgi:DNA-binding winged helix-turn-helix (wHTH) protein
VNLSAPGRQVPLPRKWCTHLVLGTLVRTAPAVIGIQHMRLKFGDCVLDTRAHQLARAGAPLSLEPKMYQLLEILITRRGSVVANEELDEILWPKVYVARTSLTRLVSELRTLLGDSARDPHIIRTVYKRGYAFCADVSSELAADSAPTLLELLWNGKVLPLPDGEHIAGRNPDCPLFIDAQTVSRRHARLTVSSGNATIEDLDSTNGTRVQGKRIAAPTLLESGSEIVLGEEVLLLRRRDRSPLTVKVDTPKEQLPDGHLRPKRR